VLRIVHLEEIEALLLQLPGLVQQQDQRNPEFSARVRNWLTALEGVLIANRLHQAGGVAAIRSSLIAAEHGQIPADLKFRGQPTRSRVLNSVASQCLQQAAALATTLVSENRARVSEAERITRQVVAAGMSRGLFRVESQRDHTQYLRLLRRALAEGGDLEPAIVHVEGLVGPHDLLVLLDRALALHLQVTQ
jgi:hypothetical protein